jgi:transcription elongation factor Elf1
MVRVVGTCRKCGKRNIVWVTKNHMITMSMVPCEHCGSDDSHSIKKKAPKGMAGTAATVGVQWSGSVFGGKVVSRNYPERAREGDLVI